MVEELEILEPKKRNYRRAGVYTVSALVLLLILFFGIKAYSLTRSVIVNRTSGGSPYLASGDIDDWVKGKNLEKLSQGDRRINILLLGVGGDNHPGGNLADTIMVVSLDPKNKEVAMLSIPRDTYVKVEDYGGTKINGVLSINDGEMKKGEKNFDLMKKTVGEFLGVPIHYFALVNFDAFREIIDIFGGVDVYVGKDLYDPLFPDENVLGYDELYIKKGDHHFDGEMALKYARSRETTSDFDRARRQQEILVALKEKATQRDNLLSIKRISQTLNVLKDNIKTDLQLGEMEALAQFSKDIDKEKISSKVLDESTTGIVHSDNYEGMYVLVPNDSTLKEVHLFISQYFKDPFLAGENAKIVLNNGTKNEYTKNLVIKDISMFDFDISESSESGTKEYKKTFIYDYSNGAKKGTTAFLKQFFGEDIQVVVLKDQGKEYDIEIVLGTDYKYKSQ